MAFLSSMNIAASGLTAQQLRLDVVAENITNSNTTRTEGGGAYRRKMVVFEAETGRDTFRDVMARTANGLASNEGYANAGGVKVTQIVEDPSPLKTVYVDMVKEMTDAMAATQAYSANVTAFNALKTVVNQALQIGR